VLQVTSRTRVLDPLGPVAAYVGDWSIDGSDHVGQADLGRRPCQPETTRRSALTLHDPGVLEVEQHALEELDRDVLPRGERVALRRPSGAATASSAAARSA
jgi:hypothetical protein